MTIRKIIPLICITTSFACCSQSKNEELKPNCFNYRPDSIEVQNEFNLLFSDTISVERTIEISSDLFHKKSKILVNQSTTKIDTILRIKTYNQLKVIIEKHLNDYRLREASLVWGISSKRYNDVHNDIIGILEKIKNNHDFFGLKTEDKILKDLNHFNKQLFNYSKQNFKKVCDTIHKYFDNDIPNNISLANYYRLEKDYEKALDLLFQSDLGIGFDQDGNMLEDHTDEIKFHYGLIYKDKNDKQNALKYFKMVKNEYSMFYTWAQEEIKELKK